MKYKTQIDVAHYVVSLMNEGFTALHVTQLIPSAPSPRVGKVGDGNWTQFPKLCEMAMEILADNDIAYDQPSGWFRKEETK